MRLTPTDRHPNRADAHVIAGVVAVDLANHRGLRVDDFVEGIAVRSLLMVAVAIGRVGEDGDFAASCPMTLAAPGTFENLCALIFCDHALELNEEMVFGGLHRRCVHKHGFNALPGELLDDQNLVGIAAAQAVRSIGYEPDPCRNAR